MLIDPFAKGRVINQQEAMIAPPDFRRRSGVVGRIAPPGIHRLWLTRMLQNLLNTYGSKGQYREVAAMLEMEMLLWRARRDSARFGAGPGPLRSLGPARVWPINI